MWLTLNNTDLFKVIGIPGLSLLVIISLIYTAQHMWSTGKSLPLLTGLIALSIVSAVFIGYISLIPAYSWIYTGLRADWATDDADCSDSQIPAREKCGSGWEGRIAVCWDYNSGYPGGASGETGGALGETGGALGKKCNSKTLSPTWCTYKRREKGALLTTVTGTNTGLVYLCARRFP